MGGEGEWRPWGAEAFGDWKSPCLAGVRAAQGFCSLSGEHRGVCGVRGARGGLRGVTFGELGRFWEVFLGVCEENLV